MFQDHFSRSASGYARFRPEYPPELFHWLGHAAPARLRAWDAATGSGQAAKGLAAIFGEVVATDASAEQIRHAWPCRGVRYHVAASEHVPIENHTVDLTLAAQALHWFDIDAFFGEVRRVSRPGGVLAAVCYGLFRCEPKLDRLIDHLYSVVLGDFWPAERRLIDERYRTIAFPFDEIATPEFEMSARWSLDHLLGYLATWSALARARERTGADPLESLKPEFRNLWPEPLQFRRIVWPLTVRAGRV